MITAAIPSRYGASRLEGKPLAMNAGKPMIQRVYKQALRSTAIADISGLGPEDIKRIEDKIKHNLIP